MDCNYDFAKLSHNYTLHRPHTLLPSVECKKRSLYNLPISLHFFYRMCVCVGMCLDSWKRYLHSLHNQIMGIWTVLYTSTSRIRPWLWPCQRQLFKLVTGEIRAHLLWVTQFSKCLINNIRVHMYLSMPNISISINYIHIFTLLWINLWLTRLNLARDELLSFISNSLSLSTGCWCGWCPTMAISPIPDLCSLLRYLRISCLAGL